MTRVDDIFKSNLRDILSNGSWDENPRPKYESDGKPANTLFITDVYEKYYSDETPITNLRPIAWKSSIREMMVIYQMQSNTQEGFESHKVNWWSAWMNDEGNLGRAYSYNLESHRENEMNRDIVEVKQRLVDKKFSEIKPVIERKVDLDKSVDGEVYFDKFIILDDKVYNEKRKRYWKKIQFIDTGYIKTVESFAHKGGTTPYDRTYAEIGYLGNYETVENFTKKEIDILKRRWISMLSRCYHSSASHKKYKDGKIFVHQEWHSFENFLRDMRHLPQFHLAREDSFEGWNLDKDYYLSNAYSKDSCVWITVSDNQSYKKDIKPINIIDDSGKKTMFLSLSEASRFLECTHQTVAQSLNRNCKAKGYKTEYVESDSIFRYELSKNQINELLYNLKHNKFSRRHMTSFFNWANQDKKALVECAFMTLWSVRINEKGEYVLDLSLTQRSSDYLTAGHVNTVQYKALQMMVAKHLGYEVGTFSRHTMNLHVYDRHFEQMEEILKREYKGNEPKLILNVPDGTDFYDISIDNFEIIGYNPIKPQLKFELGI